MHLILFTQPGLKLPQFKQKPFLRLVVPSLSTPILVNEIK